MKNIISAAALAAGLLPVAATAQEEAGKPAVALSGSATLASDYRFRGASQSDKEMAVQGGLTLTHESGAYAGAWASNLAGWGTFGGANMELDLIAGYKARSPTMRPSTWGLSGTCIRAAPTNPILPNPMSS